MSKNNIPNSIGYNGLVTIKIIDNRTKKIIKEQRIKNAGTINLFKYLCECLKGEVDVSQRPRYLDASANSISPNTPNSLLSDFKSCLYYRSLLTSSSLYLDTTATTIETGSAISFSNYHCKFSTTILKGQLNSTGTEPIKSLILSNSPSSADNASSILAWINLPSDQEISLDNEAYQTILIEWDLSFNNFVKNEVTE